MSQENVEVVRRIYEEFLGGPEGSENPAVLGCATAAFVARGLGSDHGDFDVAVADAFASASLPICERA